MIRSARSKKKILFPLLAISVGLLPFVTLEIIFRLFDIANPTEVVDTSSGFSGHQPLFSLGADGANYSTTRNRALYFGDQSFAASKADDTYRMFFLGGSTVRGRPYAVDSAFAKWVEIELNQRSQKTTYESINCGGLSYASFRLTHINREVLEYNPDLIVIATGHNEFLENRTFEKQSSQAEVRSALESLRLVVWLRSMIGQDVESFKDSSQDTLPDNVTARLDSESGYASYNWDPKWVASITAQYESSLEAMIQQCQQANVDIVLVCLGSNLRDCPPFKSEFNEKVAPEAQQRFLDLFEQATLLANQPRQALKHYQSCLKITDQFALLHYRMARAYEQIGEPDTAKKHYLIAKDTDLCPLRLTEEMDKIQRTLARKHKVPIVDARAAIESSSVRNIPGYEMYVDHVHPTLHGHQLIAGAIVDELITQDIVLPDLELDVQQYQQLYGQHIQSLPLAFFANGARRVGWLENWARRDLLVKELEPFDLRGELAVVHRHLGFDETEHAIQELNKVADKYESITEPTLQLALTFQSHGRYQPARSVLEWLLEYETEANLLQEIQYARMINAESMGDRGVAILIYDNFFERLPFEVEANQSWRRFVPDIWERVRLEDL